MASLLAPNIYRCYYCQFESTDSSFKYFDNKKVDQPRHQCRNCHKLFTLGSHGRPQGKTYAKKRNEDPPELKSLSRQCRHCGVADNALFKYYNNNNLLQPRFKCLSCGKQFQMRLMGTGDEMRLVHTSCNQRHATGRCKKPGVPEEFTNASNLGEESYQPSDGSFMPEPVDPLMPREPGARLLPECCDEDEQYASFLEAELSDDNEPPHAGPISGNANLDDGSLPEMSAEDEPPNAGPISGNANLDDGSLPEMSAEDLECLALLESESLTDENIADLISCTLNGLAPALLAENAEYLAPTEAQNADTFSSTANVDDGLPPWSDNDAMLMDFDFVETGVRTDESDDAEMVSENMADTDSDCTSNAEVVSGTLLVETLAPAESDSSSNDTIENPSSLNYLDAAVECCKRMDMAHSMPVAPVQFGESSSSSAGLTTSFGDSSCDTSEPFSFQQDLMEEDQRSFVDWDEGQEEMSPWSYPRPN